MPQFTAKDMLLATTLIAVGAGVQSFLVRNPDALRGPGDIAALLMLLGYCGGACIGAGLLLPFKRALKGAVIGIAVQSLFIAMYFIGWSNAVQDIVHDMPRFTVKDLLIATTRIAVGAGTMAFVFHVDELARVPGLWRTRGGADLVVAEM